MKYAVVYPLHSLHFPVFSKLRPTLPNVPPAIDFFTIGADRAGSRKFDSNESRAAIP
jgi:hypothetical protein